MDLEVLYMIKKFLYLENRYNYINLNGLIMQQLLWLMISNHL